MPVVRFHLCGTIGNPVKIGNGPAAVTGDESHRDATVCFKADGKAW